MSVLRRPPSSLFNAVRLIHSSAKTCNLVGPIDPISHLRPIIYDDALPVSPPSLLRHPYSLSEFNSGTPNRVGEYELQFKLHRQQLDSFHQNFWLDSNTRFEAAKQAILSSLPVSSTPLDKEKALSEFYKQWVMQEIRRTREYTDESRKRNISLIMLGARVKYHRFTSLISNIMQFEKKQ